MRKTVAILALMALGACVQAGPAEPPLAVAAPQAFSVPVSEVNSFAAVVQRVEPVAEAYCRHLNIASRCVFRIAIDDRPKVPANAYQTVDDQDRPIIAFTAALLTQAHNADELAFIMGHEAAHHILGHLPKQEQSALTGALLAGVMAKSAGATEVEVRKAQQAGATVAARIYSKDFELQADALGAEIALAAGYDPIRGAAYFDRLPDPGDQFLASHPGNSQRKVLVASTVRQLRAGG